MKLSSPVHILKNQAKTLKRENAISMAEALDSIAKREGYSSWSLLKSKQSSVMPNSYNEVLNYFNEGDLVLIGARPATGKTSFSIGLLVQAIQAKKAKNFYFTLSEVHKDLAGRIASYDESVGGNNPFLGFSYSNDIQASYIIKNTEEEISRGSLIVIDYLQLLDERRINAPLQEQVESLKEYAKKTGAIIIFISQLNREIENRIDRKPSLDDIRLPNPLDLNLMNKILLLFRKNKDSNIADVLFFKPKDHEFKVNWDGKNVKFS
jgi:replicative DNA helicase